jgi:hypothetical protein
LGSSIAFGKHSRISALNRLNIASSGLGRERIASSTDFTDGIPEINSFTDNGMATGKIITGKIWRF